MKILGIDPSLTSTGVAGLTDDLQVITHRVESAPPKRAKGDKTPASLAERHERIVSIGERVAAASIEGGWAPDLAVMEGPSYGSVGGAQHDRSGLWWHLARLFLIAGIPVAVCPPAVRAKWATGSGVAGKGQVSVPVSRMWPQLDAGLSDDEWDAVALASIGAQHLGLLPVELARHREQLAKVAWPELVSA